MSDNAAIFRKFEAAVEQALREMKQELLGNSEVDAAQSSPDLWTAQKVEEECRKRRITLFNSGEFDRKAVCKFFHISMSKLERWRDEGIIQGYTIANSRPRFTLEEVAQVKNKRTGKN